MSLASISPRCSMLFLVLLAGAAFALGFLTHDGMLTPPRVRADKTTVDPLTDLNNHFRSMYAGARQEVLARSGPVILANGDDLILRRGGQRTEVHFMPEIYHTLKAVDHVPLAIYVVLAPHGEGEVPTARLDVLRDHRARLPDIRKALESKSLSETQLKRQKTILDASQAYLDGVLESKKWSRAALLSLLQHLRPFILENVAESAKAQIDATNKQVQAWKAEMPADEWKRLHVIVIGSAMPRKNNTAVQYFAKLLGEPGEGLRIVYAEALWEEPKALNLLGTMLLDTEVGSDFFDEKLRMHRDLIGDAAAAYLKKMTFEQ